MGLVFYHSNAAFATLCNNANPIETASAPIKNDPENFHREDRLRQTKVRVGQQQFRLAVLSAYDHSCCITGVTLPELLIASHIVPWSDDPSQRLNPNNGLCLSSLFDAAFDKGLISLNDHLELILSSKLTHANNAYLSNSFAPFEGKTITLPNKYRPDPVFIAHHRANIFGRSG